ncbi:MAG: PH domain-containing protein [Syntrophaceae bacterium]
MWDIQAKNLQKDETIEFTDKPSMLSCILAYAWVGIMAFSTISMIISFAVVNDPGILMTSLIWVILAVPGILIILQRLSTRYAISNKGLLQRVGIITTSIKTVPFKHITSLEVKETIPGKIFRYAHLIIDTSGSGKAIELNWNYLRAAHKVKNLVETHLNT